MCVVPSHPTVVIGVFVCVCNCFFPPLFCQYTSYGTGDGKSRTVLLSLATTKDPTKATGWTRHGAVFPSYQGSKSAALLSINDNVAGKILRLEQEDDAGWTTTDVSLPGTGQAGIAFADEDEALGIANDVTYGLASGMILALGDRGDQAGRFALGNEIGLGHFPGACCAAINRDKVIAIESGCGS